MSELLKIFLFAFVFLTLFGLAEFLRYFAGVKGETSRKLVHIFTGIITLFFPIYLDNHWSVLFLCGSFAVLLVASKIFRLLKSINDVNRITHGSILYPVAVYGSFVIFSVKGNLIYFHLPILTLAICDPLAAYFGKKYGKARLNFCKDIKTVAGTMTFALSAYVISIISLLYFVEIPLMVLIIFSLLYAIVTAFAEALSKNGFDNLFIPLSGIVLLWLADIFNLISL
ncbi:MAG: diacylglycerol/polyprenol kinase family protein [Cytophagaceae bacterium]